jgi:hypothetical protein
MPYIGNVTTSSNVNGSQINNGTITGDKLSLPFDYDSATLYLDNTNNRVGILTASPSSTLTVGTGGVVSIPLASAATPSLVFGTDTNTGIYSPGADQVAISTAGSGRLFVNSAGTVNVKTTGGSDLFYVDDNTSKFYFSPNGSGEGIIKLDTANAIRFLNAGGERLRITSAGLVGVGTSVPDIFSRSHAQIVGISSASGSSYIQLNGSTGNRGGIELGAGGTRYGSLQAEASGLDLGTNAALPISLSTNNVTRVTVTSAGLVGIGTSAPSTKLEISGNEATANFIVATNTDAFAWSGFRLRNTGTSGRSYDIGLGGNSSGASTAGNFYVYDNTAGAQRITLDSSGRVGIGTTSPEGKLEVSAGNAEGLRLSSPSYLSTSQGPWIAFNGGPSAGWDLARVQGIRRGSNAEGALVFYTNNGGGAPGTISEKARIDETGRLLVGTATASSGEAQYSRFVVQGAGTNPGVNAHISLLRGQNLATTPVSAGVAVGLINFGDSAGNPFAFIEAETDGTTASGDYPGRLVFSTTSDGAASPTERLRITSAGLVGIGSSAPTQKLQVDSGNIFLNGTDQFIYLSNDSDQWLSANGPSNYIRIGAGGQERVRITGAGNVGIGTTGPVATLQVDASGGGTIRVLRSSSSANYVQLEHDGTNGTISSFGATGNLLFNVNAAERARIDSSGRLLVGTSTGHGTLQVHDGTFVLSKPATGSERNWRLLPSDAAAGDLAIQQSTTAGGTTYATKLTIDPSGRVGINHTSPQFGLTLGQAGTDFGKLGWEDGSNNKRASITCGSSTDALQFHTGTAHPSSQEVQRFTHSLVVALG